MEDVVIHFRHLISSNCERNREKNSGLEFLKNVDCQHF